MPCTPPRRLGDVRPLPGGACGCAVDHGFGAAPAVPGDVQYGIRLVNGLLCPLACIVRPGTKLYSALPQPHCALSQPLLALVGFAFALLQPLLALLQPLLGLAGTRCDREMQHRLGRGLRCTVHTFKDAPSAVARQGATTGPAHAVCGLPLMTGMTPCCLAFSLAAADPM